MLILFVIVNSLCKVLTPISNNALIKNYLLVSYLESSYKKEMNMLIFFMIVNFNYEILKLSSNNSLIENYLLVFYKVSSYKRNKYAHLSSSW